MYNARKRELERQALRGHASTADTVLQRAQRMVSSLDGERRVVPELRATLADVETQRAACQGPAQIREFHRLAREASRLKRQIDELESGEAVQGFVERVGPLLKRAKRDDVTVQQKREALAMQLFHGDKAVPVFLDPERCTHCGEHFRQVSEEALDVCPNCRLTQRRLALATDHVDVDYVAQDTHANHTVSTLANNVDNTGDPDGAFPKPELFFQFLMQMCDEVADPPKRVFEVVLRELTKVHVHHQGKVHATPVGAILKVNGMKDWAWMAFRIALHLKRRPGDPLLLIPRALILKLVRRFEKVIDAAKRSRCRHRKRVYNPRYMAKVLLTMEGEYERAELYENHKTRAVLRREDERLRDLCRYIKAEMNPEGDNWEPVRSL